MSILNRELVMDKTTGSFFEQLRNLAHFVDRGVIESMTKFEQKNREFCAPEVLTSLSAVKREVKTLEEKLDEELLRSREQRKASDKIIQYQKLFLANHSEKISKAETYLQKYGFQVKEFDEEPSPSVKDEEPGNTPTIVSVESTPACFSQRKSKLNRTPQLEYALSQVTLDNHCATDKKKARSLKKELDFAQPLASKSRELDENVRNPSDPGEERVIDEDKGQEQEQEVTGNVDVEDLHVPVERSDKTFCLSAGPITPPSVRFNQPTKLNRTPQLENAGLSKQMLDRIAALEKREKQAPRNVKKEPTIQQQVPLCFQHDGIICTPSLFGGKMDRSVLNISEALASPIPRSFSVQKHDGNTEIFEPSRVSKHLDLTSTETDSYSTGTSYHVESKENITPKEPELLTQRLNRGKEDQASKEEEKPWKKPVLNDMPKSPKLFGMYNFSK